MKILVAEDDRITRRMLQRQLEQWDYEVVAAADGSAAWAEFEQHRFDIVVTDWDMPVVDGRELIARIRGREHGRYVYLIMLTGRTEKTDLVAGMEAGADDFLAKPFDRHELRVRLRAGERIIELERTLAKNNEMLRGANERMKRDLDAAAKAQRALLPDRLPEELGARFAWHYEPCDELGGDTLNVVPLDERRVALYLLDVTGHGVPAALLSVTVARVLSTRDPASSILVRPDRASGHVVINEPHQVAERLNRQFPMSKLTDRFFTLVYAVLDVETRELTYVLAGQPPPLLVRAGESPRELEGVGYPIGITDRPEYEDHVIQLELGDRLFFYSDGVTEAINEREEMLDTEGFMRLIEETRHHALDQAMVHCVENFKRWCDPAPLSDDVSILALEIPLRS